MKGKKKKTTKTGKKTGLNLKKRKEANTLKKKKKKKKRTKI